MYEDSELLLRYAEETDDDSYDSAVEYEFYNGTDPWDENPYEGRVFHGFSQLPPELRLRIWELGLVEAARPRVLQFEVRAVPRKMPGVFTENEYGDQIQRLFRDWHVRPGKDLARVTKRTRILMAVNREAREVARKILPHTLKVQNPARNGYGMVSFNRDRDVVQIDGYEKGHISPWAPDERLEDSAYHFDGFAENVVQLAIDEHAFNDNDTDTNTDPYFTHAMEPFHNLKRLFLLAQSVVPLAPYVQRWCGSDFVYTHTTAIKDRGNDYFWTKRCWPNADDYDDFVRNNVPTPPIRDVSRPFPFTRSGISVLPMLAFDDSECLKALDKARVRWRESYERGVPIWEVSDSSSDSDTSSQSEPDEYESEGIDDSEIIENDSEDNSNEDDMSGDEVYDDDDDVTLDGNEVGEIVPVFSSPEPEPKPTGLGSSTPDAQNSRKRRIVADSDDEDPSEGQGAKRARTSRPARVVTSDTEDEGVSEPNSNRRSRKRAAIVDSDEEEDDDDDNDVEVKGMDEDRSSSKKDGKGASNGVKSNHRDEDDDEDDDEKDEEEDEEEEVTDVKQLSLASRLNLAPQKHSSSRKRTAEDDMSTDPEEYSEDDDEDDEDDEDDDEERSEDDLIDGIAEESEEDDYE
ncbi:hypothetical protein Trihar35433_8785 [Trichoderma harzianum]|nr:hypothetical protein Trihar35433_8785 [Trichoderma harzianum]